MRIHHIIASSLLALAFGAQAGDGHNHGHEHGHEHQSLHGGIVTEAKDMDFELVAKPDQIALHVRDHGKPASAKGGTAKLTLLNGAEKTTVTLSPAGDSHLQATGSFAIKSGTKVVALVTLAGKKPINVRFSIK
ncbi:MAG: hypothetical protein Q7V20_19750 [Aquabacterium sp.]|jgi:hypothetical protein|uniref:hypothetical protein n=1 Tax=Aquabacterium sp. TaxID=1872578 RepID=UPI002719C872|nr:hypothetical protein [Aquabacterium sp.]MDO9005687.1 hypothetical protein [Aquabacterium sp.]